ncbi:MAG: spore maturation protein [Clostridia bacterium]|nr:spore maturation protein [Clostridia bacterium]
MLNIIWVIMMLVSFAVAAINGNMEATMSALLDSGGKAVEFLISVGGIMAMWSGFMAIAEKAGLVDMISDFMSPVIKLLFKGARNNAECRRAISMNIVANFFGLSNAATPLGIKAMKQLDAQNAVKGVASDDMCMLAVINSASVQLIPSTLIAMRAAAGSTNPGSIILPIWIVSVITAATGICLAKLLARKGGKLCS